MVWYGTSCPQAEDFYFLNDELAAEREANIGAVFTGEPAGAGGGGDLVGGVLAP